MSGHVAPPPTRAHLSAYVECRARPVGLPAHIPARRRPSVLLHTCPASGRTDAPTDKPVIPTIIDECSIGARPPRVVCLATNYNWN